MEGTLHSPIYQGMEGVLGYDLVTHLSSLINVSDNSETGHPRSSRYIWAYKLCIYIDM